MKAKRHGSKSDLQGKRWFYLLGRAKCPFFASLQMLKLKSKKKAKKKKTRDLNNWLKASEQLSERTLVSISLV